MMMKKSELLKASATNSFDKKTQSGSAQAG